MASLAAVFGPDTQPKADEQDAFWDLIDFNDGRRVMPGLLQYLKERRRNRDRWVDALAGSPVPLMFIDGLLDPVSGAGMAEGWRRMVPQGELVELAGIGHYPQIEDPEEGVISLSGRRDGRRVRFCWKIGDETITHWYREGESFEQRRPLELA